MIHPPSLITDLNLDLVHPNAAPGHTIFLKRGKTLRLLCIRCRAGWVAVDGITYDKRKPMKAMDFANGFLKEQDQPHFVADL